MILIIDFEFDFGREKEQTQCFLSLNSVRSRFFLRNSFLFADFCFDFGFFFSLTFLLCLIFNSHPFFPPRFFSFSQYSIFFRAVLFCFSFGSLRKFAVAACAAASSSSLRVHQRRSGSPGDAPRRAKQRARAAPGSATAASGCRALGKDAVPKFVVAD